ncbi:MAG: sugar (pentulose or hexulose) kinase [Granulosicoccus sp.]|jgi:sugar (pentulose or hexulose) kinase
MTRFVAVIDLGKTNSKLALVDTALAVEAQVIKQATPVNTDSLYPSLDHLAIEAFIIESLSMLAKKQQLDAIIVTTHGATAALIDASGQLALPVLDYEFKGVDETRTSYDQYRPPFSDTGSPALPGGLNIGAQLYWQQSNFPEQFATVQTVLTWPQYWTFILTGDRHNDVTSLGCHTDLYEPDNQCYSTLLDDMNWRALMPPTKHSGELSGTLRPAVAQKLGLPASTPVYTGIHDSNASLVPHLMTQITPLTVVSTGTWFVVMAMGGKSSMLDETRDTLLNVNARGQSVPSARFMGGRERDLLHVSSPINDESVESLLGNTESPLMLMPSVVANTGPYPNAHKRWIGTTDNDAALDACVVAFYLALMTHECMKLVGAKGPTFIEGPLAQDQFYASMLAAVSNRPVMISGSQTGTSVGAAMLISAPDKLPDYPSVELDSVRRRKLHRYAMLWQEQLLHYAK